MLYNKTAFCKRAGITPETLRHYLDIGLIEPAEIDANGYRKFSEENILELWFYRLGASLGTPLRNVKEWKSSMTLADFHQELSQREAGIRKKIFELENQLSMIQEIDSYVMQEMHHQEAISAEPGLEGYQVFCDGNPGMMNQFAKAFPYCSIIICYPFPLAESGQLNGRLGICVMKDRLNHVGKVKLEQLEHMPSGQSFCMSLITRQPLSLTKKDFMPLLDFLAAHNLQAKSDIYCSVFYKEGRYQEESYLLKCRVLV